MSGKDEPTWKNDFNNQNPPPYFDPLLVMAEAFTHSPNPDIPAYDEPLGTCRVEHNDDGSISYHMDLNDTGKKLFHTLELKDAFNKEYLGNEDDATEEDDPPPVYAYGNGLPVRRLSTAFKTSITDLPPEDQEVIEKLTIPETFPKNFEYIQLPSDKFEPDTSLRTRTQIVEIRKGFSQITKILVAIVAVIVATTISALTAVLAGGLWVFWKLLVQFVTFIRHIVEDLDGS